MSKNHEQVPFFKKKNFRLAMKLVCGISFAFHSKSLALWIKGSFPFLFFSLLIVGCHASSLVLGSEVVLLVFFNIPNNYKYETMT